MSVGIESRFLTKRPVPSWARTVQRLFFSSHQDGYVLMANQIIAAALGMAYWAVAGRMYSSNAVGAAASTISFVTLILLLAELGVKGMFIRYVPTLGQERRFFVLKCYLASAAASFLLVKVAFQFDMDRFFGDVCSSDGCHWIEWAAVAVTIFYIQDGVLIAMKMPWLVLIVNAGYNATKLALIVAIGSLASGNAILISWFAPLPFFIIAANLVIFGSRPAAGPSKAVANRSGYIKMARQTSWHYVGSLVNEAVGRILPLIIFQQLGSSATAYFFLAWLIAGTLRLLSSSLGASFTVDAVANPAALPSISRKSLALMVGVTALSAAIVIAGAPWILRIIGAEYAEQATPILRLLALATIPYSVSIWIGCYARIIESSRVVFLCNSVQALGCLGLTLLSIHSLGLTGVGIACVVAQILGLVPAYSLVTSALQKPDLASSSRSALARSWRRLDWRFLSRNPWPSAAACDSPAMADALGLICRSVSVLNGVERHNNDLVTITDTSRAAIDHATRQLKPSGELCWIGSARHLARVRAHLGDAGYEIRGAYLGIPRILQARMYLPLPARSETVAFILSYRLPGFWAAPKLLLACFARLLAGFVNLGLGGEVALLARPRHPEGHGEESAPCFPDHAMNGLAVAGGRRVDSAVCAFVWKDTRDPPSFVVKRGRNPEGARLVGNEAGILAALNLRFERPDHMIVPELVAAKSVAGDVETIQSYAPGVQVDRSGQDFTTAAVVLAEFQMCLGSCTVGPRPPDHNPAVEWGELLHDRGLLDDAELRDVNRRMARLSALPCVIAHNDFTPWNALLDGQRLAVIDWSEGDEQGYPGVDLACMLFHLAFVDKGVEGKNATAEFYQSIIQGRSRYALIDELMQEYLTRLSLDPLLVPELRVAVWLYRAKCELRLIEAEKGAEGRKALPATSIMLGLLKAELTLQSASPARALSVTSSHAPDGAM